MTDPSEAEVPYGQLAARVRLLEQQVQQLLSQQSARTCVDTSARSQGEGESVDFIDCLQCRQLLASSRA